MATRLEAPLSQIEVTNYDGIPKDEETSFQDEVLDGHKEGKVK
jgi:hypothetical protein